jgi:hypothetical protein
LGCAVQDTQPDQHLLGLGQPTSAHQGLDATLKVGDQALGRIQRFADGDGRGETTSFLLELLFRIP